jgi:calcium-dependent protein kinase
MEDNNSSNNNKIHEESKSQLNISREIFVKNIKDDITKYYEVIKKIGEGSFGKVYKVKNKDSGEERAMKQVAKDKIPDLGNFKNEIKILKMLDHPNIIRLYEVFEDDKNFYLFNELCSGGSLVNKITNAKEKLTEKEMAKIFKQLVSAVAYCHEKGVCHRDIKLDNILFLTNDKNSTLKLIDFGLSIEFKQKKLSTKLGTLLYISPEIVKGNYDEKCDLWACGVILYVLITGCQPFEAKTDKEIYKNITKETYDLTSSEWKLRSKSLKDLIKHLLCADTIRYTAKQVLESKWIKEKGNDNSDVDLNYFDSLKMVEYQFYNDLKKSVLIFIASRLGGESKNIRQLFLTMDEDKDGKINIEDFNRALFNNDQTKELNFDDIKEIFVGIDTDKNGYIEFTEFLAANLDKNTYLKDERLKEAFKAFNLEDNGYINKNELIKVFQLEDNANNEKIIKKLIEDNDFDKDGRINYNDFVQMMKKEVSLEQ